MNIKKITTLLFLMTLSSMAAAKSYVCDSGTPTDIPLWQLAYYTQPNVSAYEFKHCVEKDPSSPAAAQPIDFIIADCNPYNHFDGFTCRAIQHPKQYTRIYASAGWEIQGFRYGKVVAINDPTLKFGDKIGEVYITFQHAKK